MACSLLFACMTAIFLERTISCSLVAGGPEAWSAPCHVVVAVHTHDAILHMAFPVPSHLPRKAASQDISSRILSKISSATVKTLNADLAASWVAELDEAVLESKVHPHVSELYNL